MRPAQSARVRLAVEPTEEEARSLHRVLEAHFRHPLHLEIEVDSTIIGGVWVRVGDVVIDGSLRGRLEALRQHLRSRARAMLGSASLRLVRVAAQPEPGGGAPSDAAGDISAQAAQS